MTAPVWTSHPITNRVAYATEHGGRRYVVSGRLDREWTAWHESLTDEHDYDALDSTLPGGFWPSRDEAQAACERHMEGK